MYSRRKFLRDASWVVGMGTTAPAAFKSEAQQTTSGAWTPTPEQSAAWVAKAEALKPALTEVNEPPLCLVRPVADPSLYLRWRMETDAPAEALREKTFNAGDSFTLDFGGHRAGFLSFLLEGVGHSVDAPARLKLTFGEVPGTVAEPLHPYHGNLSEAWLPEEIITVDFLPQRVRMPRRYAFRYVRVDVIATSSSYAARMTDFTAHGVSSATETPAPLPLTVPENLRRIDAVSLKTLHDCMQTVFEDGVKRDQRLWIGDMRVQAMANYATFRNYALARRCLYLLAAFPREDGMLHANVFEKPTPRASGDVCLDYAALYVAMLADYVQASGDVATGRDLWPVAQRQLELVGRNVNQQGIVVIPEKVWVFIDWQQALDKTASMHGVLLYCYRRGQELARTLGDDRSAAAYGKQIAAMTAAARSAFFDAQRGVFVSGPARQVSWASQAWMVLAEVARGQEAATALQRAMADPDAVLPGTPYLHHTMLEALTACGEREAARKLMDGYWGAMVDDGADTFWEVFDPKDSRFSPYGDVHINSFCHGWSGTPAWFLRTGRI